MALGRAGIKQRKTEIGMVEPAEAFDASLAEEKSSKVGPAGIDIAYQRAGKPDAPAVLLAAGLASRLGERGCAL
jgi:hypothetical protein